MIKKLLLLAIIPVVILACSAAKQTEEALNTGNYDQAINIALKSLSTNKHKKGKQEYIVMLEQAFAKAKTRDEDRIAFLNKEGNEAHLEEVYNIYNLLNDRQNKIRPLLPLQLIESNRQANFNFENYDAKIIDTKNKLAAYLYKNANELMSSTSKFGFRQAFEDFKYLDKISPNYKDTRSLINEAHIRGTDFILVDMKNQTQKVIPKRLEEDLLNFSTYGLDDLWTVYHSNKQPMTKYDFDMSIELRNINISPEQIREKIIVREKQILDGKKDLVDENGNVVKDSLGNAIQVDKYKTITCEVTKFTQFKSTQVVGIVKYSDLTTKQLMDSFPLDSEFIFEHSYATYNGDRNALDTSYNELIRLRAIPFPTNEQMIFDTGEDLKNKIKAIITKQVFR